MTLMRQQNSKMDRLRIGADQQGNPIWKVVRNVKTDSVDFIDENADANDDDYDFAFVGYRDWFG
jgi:hypothetical protein